ncbi:MAG: hypothetical protein PCFJNLEI_04152 [Verrucomicrobiae bacterium]|nr:hypothetical protein [Verrucomicrobiae bacterium]
MPLFRWITTALLPAKVMAVPVSVFVPVPPLCSVIALLVNAAKVLVAVNCVSVLVPNCRLSVGLPEAGGELGLLVQFCTPTVLLHAPLPKPQMKSATFVYDE